LFNQGFSFKLFKMPQFDKTTISFLLLAIIICYAFYFFRSYIFEKTNENKIVFGVLSILFSLKILIEEAYLPRECNAFTILLTLPLFFLKNDFILKQKIFLCSCVILIFVTQLLFSFKILSIVGFLLTHIILTFVFLLFFLKMENEMLYEKKLLILYCVSLLLFFEFAFLYSVFY
jgi:hypothetical protein